MIRIEIQVNGKMVRQFFCTEADFQNKFNYAHNIAGGMWNGTDEIVVTSFNI